MGLGIPAPLACALQGYLKELMTKKPWNLTIYFDTEEELREYMARNDLDGQEYLFGETEFVEEYIAGENSDD